jgi:cellulose synthase (UDP-forming)
MPATLQLADGTRVICETEDFSMLGLGLTTYVLNSLQPGDLVRVGLSAEGQEHWFPAKVVMLRMNHIGLQLMDLSIEEERNYVRCTFADPDAWRDWDRGTRVDEPLASFAEVFSFGATGYVRLCESLYAGITGWWRGEQRTTA